MTAAVLRRRTKTALRRSRALRTQAGAGERRGCANRPSAPVPIVGAPAVSGPNGCSTPPGGVLATARREHVRSCSERDGGRRSTFGPLARRASESPPDLPARPRSAAA
jgi:hypothetical protein